MNVSQLILLFESNNLYKAKLNERGKTNSLMNLKAGWFELTFNGFIRIWITIIIRVTIPDHYLLIVGTQSTLLEMFVGVAYWKIME